MDELIEILEAELKRLEGIPRFADLIPQVGSNMVYSRESPKSIQDVAALSGRIVKSMGEPLLCGNVAYGSSRYLASVVLEAIRLDPEKRAAVNIRVTDDMSRRLSSIGLEAVTIPSEIEGDGCPVTLYLRTQNELADAYIHPGAFAVEPTTTILANSPRRLVEIVRELVLVE